MTAPAEDPNAYRTNDDQSPVMRRTSQWAKWAPKVATFGRLSFAGLLLASVVVLFLDIQVWPRRLLGLSLVPPLISAVFTSFARGHVDGDPSLSGSHYLQVAEDGLEPVGNVVFGALNFVGLLFVLGMVILTGTMVCN